mmetsp:Transcript_78110/g.205627  ORF Transcript_78110/g.205627 Transcript_78110/m.205627 type:complete len:169 (+) Transcript_78110:1-507(+)
MAAAAWRDHRFTAAGSRQSFESTCHVGVCHGEMQAAGGRKTEGSHPIWNPPPMTPQGQRSAVSPAESGSRLQQSSSMYFSDPRFADSSSGAGFARGHPALGMQHSRRRTAEFDVAKASGGGHFSAQPQDLRPAGITVASTGKVAMRGWHAYKGTRISSCPNLRLVSEF